MAITRAKGRPLKCTKAGNRTAGQGWQGWQGWRASRLWMASNRGLVSMCVSLSGSLSVSWSFGILMMVIKRKVSMRSDWKRQREHQRSMTPRYPLSTSRVNMATCNYRCVHVTECLRVWLIDDWWHPYEVCSKSIAHSVLFSIHSDYILFPSNESPSEVCQSFYLSSRHFKKSFDNNFMQSKRSLRSKSFGNCSSISVLFLDFIRYRFIALFLRAWVAMQQRKKV